VPAQAPARHQAAVPHGAPAGSIYKPPRH
jgi:hypothetical protein